MDANDILTRASLLQRLPSLHRYIEVMQNLDALVAVLVLGAGLVILLQGWRIFRVWVVVTAAMVGVAIGDRVAAFLEGPYVQIGCPVAGGVLLAALAWPLMKYALGLIGAVTGGVLGHCLMRYLSVVLGRGDLAEWAWAGGIGGAIILGVSAFFIFRAVVIISSSLQGSAMVVSGVVALLLKYPPIQWKLAYALEHQPHVLPLLVLAPAVIGSIFQFLWTAPHKGSSE
jgi:hypothetical protein